MTNASTQQPGVGASSLESVRAAWSEANPMENFDWHVAHGRHFRNQFDFLADSDESIATAMTEGLSNRSIDRWSIDMTDAELAEMERRNRIGQLFPQVAAAAVGDDWSEELIEGLDPRGSFGAFGGHWIDQMNGGRLVVALVPTHHMYAATRARVAALVEGLMRDGQLVSTDVIVVDVPFTADDLHRVNRDFNHKYIYSVDDPAAIGMSASRNEVENRVDLYTEAAFLAQAFEFASGYPDGLVEVIPVLNGALNADTDVCSPTNCHPKDDWGPGNWHSGAAIDVLNGNFVSVGGCMWGATVRTTSSVYMVTAAHCLGYGQGTGVIGFYNVNITNANRRGTQTWGGDDIIAHPDQGYVAAYHGVYGDYARLQVTVPGNVDNYDCRLENWDLCGATVARREKTYESVVGDVKCVYFGFRNQYVCNPLVSNDAGISGYDNMRSINTDSNDHSLDGDSGAGWIESVLWNGVNHGNMPWPEYNTVYTHAYYVEVSGLGGPTTTCGESGVCDN